MPCRWILPFNRELTLGALAQAPLIPWRWKMDATHWWLKRYFYGPAGLVHMMPGAGNKAAPRDNDYAGKRRFHLEQEMCRLGFTWLLGRILRLLRTMGLHYFDGGVDIKRMLPCDNTTVQSLANFLPES